MTDKSMRLSFAVIAVSLAVIAVVQLRHLIPSALADGANKQEPTVVTCKVDGIVAVAGTVVIDQGKGTVPVSIRGENQVLPVRISR